MKRRLTAVLILSSLLGIALMSTGCSMRVADLTIASTRNVTLEKKDLDRLPQKRGITGVDSRWMILFFPIGIPKLEEAVDDGLAKGQGDVMLDVAVYTGGWWFLVGQNWIKVKGSVVNSREVNTQ